MVSYIWAVTFTMTPLQNAQEHNLEEEGRLNRMKARLPEGGEWRSVIEYYYRSQQERLFEKVPEAKPEQ